jgi:thiol-disulfide isomerase/thioredoxin
MRLYLLLGLCLTVLVQCQPPTDTQRYILQLTLTPQRDYGPFYPGFGFLTPDPVQDPIWGRIYQPLRGLPHHWTSLTQSMIWLNSRQLVYQHVKAGHISRAHYTYLQQQWKWTSDSTTLSARPIRCYVSLVKGYDERRQRWAVLMDTDNDGDVANEAPYYPATTRPDTIPDQVGETRQIRYEVYQDGRVQPAQIPLRVIIMGHDFLYSFPQYAVATLPGAAAGEELLVSFGFNRPGFEQTTLAPSSAVLATDKLDAQQLVEPGEFIEVADVTYRNQGVDAFTNRLRLETVGEHPSEAYSLQPGYAFHPFQTQEFRRHTPLSLTSLRGRYVYINFWGTWCAGCVEQLPYLKTLYGQLDKSRIEFVSIACHDTPARLTAFLARQPLAWPQVLATGPNALADPYKVNSFPTTVLLDPRGKIIAKNLHGTALRDKLQALGLYP